MTGSYLSTKGGAYISPCNQYRYTLERTIVDREWRTDRAVCFVMLNPSTADASQDDPTIRRCVGFARRLEREHLRVVNLYAYRTPYPAELKRAHVSGVDIIGPENDSVLAHLPGIIVCAWGPPKWDFVNRRISDVLRILGRRGDPLYCLGVAKDGSPRHPLMLRNDAELSIWTPPEAS